MKIVILSILIVCSFSCLAQTESIQVNKNLSTSELQEDFTVFESSLKKNHPNLYKYSSKQKLDSVFQEIKHTLKDRCKPIEFYRMLTPILPLIGNNHTTISPPKKLVDYLNIDAKRFPFSLYHLNDTLYVSQDGSNEYFIKEGSVLLKLNGINISDYFNKFISNISTDGRNKTQPINRASKGFSRFLAYYYDLNDQFEIEYLDKDRYPKNVMITALTTKEIIRNTTKRSNNELKEKNNYQFEISENVGVLTIKTFSPKSIKAFKSFLKNSFKEVQNKNLGSLLIDLRDNYGGFPEVSYELLSYLIKQEIKPIRTEYAITDKIYNEEHFKKNHFLKHFNNRKFSKKNDLYYEKRIAEISIKPKKVAFSKNLYVLMNSNSSSSTGQLLGLLKSFANPTFIGEESGGNPVGIVADDILTLVLPNSRIEVRIPMIYSETNVNFTNNGDGTIPNEKIELGINEFLDSNDITLERTLKLITNKKD